MLELFPSRFALWLHVIIVALCFFAILNSSLVGLAFSGVAGLLLLIAVVGFTRLIREPRGCLRFYYQPSENNISPKKTMSWYPVNQAAVPIEIRSVHGWSHWLLRLRYCEIGCYREKEMIIFFDSGSSQGRRDLRAFLLL